MPDVNIFKFEGNNFSFGGFKFWRKKYDESNTRILFVDDEEFPIVEN